MAKIRIKQKFPCGYELEIDIKTFSQVDFGDYKIGICPMCGKCKPKEEKEQ